MATRHHVRSTRILQAKFSDVSFVQSSNDWNKAYNHFKTRAGSYLGVDLETTGLNWRSDKIRLVSISDGTKTFVVDVFSAGLGCLQTLVDNHSLIMHHALFDWRFLKHAGIEITSPVYDTMLMSRLLVAGTKKKSSLEACCEAYLHKKLNKEEQLSDWTGTLSDSQIAYAAKDAQVLPSLFERMQAEISSAALDKTHKLETECLRAVVQMASNGVGVNVDGWLEAVHEFEQTSACYQTQLCNYRVINWRSPKQVKEYFKSVGLELSSTGHEVLCELPAQYPEAVVLDKYRTTSKRVSTYGNRWLQFVKNGRVYPNWKQCGTDSGRMSCTKPNVQQIPRDTFRKYIVASPGCVLVKADYSQIELRIAAKIANDPVMLQAYQNGEDLHTVTAKKVLGKETVTKADRQIAKSINFGLIYGMGAKKFKDYAKANYRVYLTLDQATTYRNLFFNTYKGLREWHKKTGNDTRNESRTLMGRRRLLDKKTPYTFRLNTPVQGTGADGLKQALVYLHTWKDFCRPVMAVHDELVVECKEQDADFVSDIVRNSMVEAMKPLITPVPVEVDVSYGTTWEK